MKQPRLGAVIYAYAWPSNSVGETEFLCSTQEHATRNLDRLLVEVEDDIVEEMNNTEPAQTREEALEELGGYPIIYKMERIK